MFLSVRHNLTIVSPCTVQENLGLVAENGFYLRDIGSTEWEALVAHVDFSWKKMALPILQVYQESTDGSCIESKESALVWHYRDADPDFGSWQVCSSCGRFTRRVAVGG